MVQHSTHGSPSTALPVSVRLGSAGRLGGLSPDQSVDFLGESDDWPFTYTLRPRTIAMLFVPGAARARQRREIMPSPKTTLEQGCQRRGGLLDAPGQRRGGQEVAR